MGSVANGVVQHTHYSVLLVRQCISVSFISNQNIWLDLVDEEKEQFLMRGKGRLYQKWHIRM